MMLQKLKYPLLAIMLHLVIAGCDGRHVIARISHRYQGCFGGYSDELTIYETKGKVIAVLGGSGEEKHAVQLTREQQDYFSSFVSELKNLEKRGICTSVEYYLVFINGDIIRREDGSCQWDGFEKLRKKIFDPNLGEIIQPSNF
jgi:hypothetical protein